MRGWNKWDSSTAILLDVFRQINWTKEENQNYFSFAVQNL